MRTTTEVQQRVRGLLIQELDRRVAVAHKRLPHRCVHNHRHTLDTRKAADGEVNETFNRITSHRSLPVAQTIGLCLYGVDDPDKWEGTICEDPIDAQRCPLFVPRQGKDELLAEFKEQLGTPGWVEENLPEVASLLWVLESEAVLVRIPWWKAIWHRWILRIRIEPVVAVKDSSHLLEMSDASLGP